MSLIKLNNVIQNYPWGSKYSLNQLFGILNPENEPQAEIWMGAHQNGCSRNAENGALLSSIIAANPAKTLGAYTEARFGELPYLFKVLAAETPLSIQVHPNKQKAEIGFERENQQGIALNASNRNYKDPNHKPELVYALTFYRAMNGFRPIKHIIELFREAKIHTLEAELTQLEQGVNDKALKQFFNSIMTLEGQRKADALQELYRSYSRPSNTKMAREALEYSQQFKAHYPDDIGLFSPLILNTVELAPGEAMFLHAETPHAYVHGTALEIMASSDNVLRAGLTPKYIDVPELIDNTIFRSILPEDIKLKPVLKSGNLSFPIPVDDFGFEILYSTDAKKEHYLRGAEILFCIEGSVTVFSGETSMELSPGESVFIGCDCLNYQYQGLGKLARAMN